MQESITLQVNQLLQRAEANDYDTVLTSYPQYSSQEVATVAEFLRNNDIYNVALVLYQHLLQQQDTADFHYGIGQYYGKNYQYQPAFTHLEKAFQLQPDRTEGANYYAYILERNALMDQANHWYQIVLSNGYDSDLWTLSHYAYFLEKYGQPTAAEQVYQTVLHRNPAYTWAVKRYALFLLKQNQPDRKLNYLEYLIIRGDAVEYEAYRRSLEYDQLALPFQTLLDLFDYFWRYLLPGQSNSEQRAAYEAKARQLKDSIHRDFDDLNELLAANQESLATWQQMIKLLVK
jgi:tetratricopeptide (TPR) repeat protein